MKTKRHRIDVAEVLREVSYDKETGLFTALHTKGCRKAGTVLNNLRNGYVRFEINGVAYAAHRLAYAIVYGEQPDEIDHINGVRSDNRIVNLRAATHVQNAKNVPRRTLKNPFRGMSQRKKTKSWRVCIFNNGEQIYIGEYKNEVEAAFNYDLASLKYHGEFGRRNFLPLVI